MRKQIVKNCEWCGKEFIAKTIYVKTCSSKCSHALASKTCEERNKRFKRIYNVDDNFLQKESNEKYYLLGLMSSDGNLSERTKSITLGQSGKEGKLCLEYVKNLLQAENPIHVSHPKIGKIAYSISIRSKQLWDNFCANNIKPNKTYNFKIPDYILQNENKLRYFFIGYIDGDGSIGVYKNMLVISFVCCPNMFYQIKNCKIFENANYCIKCGGNVIDIRFNGRNAIIFGEWLYKDLTCFQSYKYKKFKDYMGNRYQISQRLYIHELKDKVFEYMDNNPGFTSFDLQDRFNISKAKSYKWKYNWRKKNGYIK